MNISKKIFIIGFLLIFNIFWFLSSPNKILAYASCDKIDDTHYQCSDAHCPVANIYMDASAYKTLTGDTPGISSLTYIISVDETGEKYKVTDKTDFDPSGHNYEFSPPNTNPIFRTIKPGLDQYQVFFPYLLNPGSHFIYVQRWYSGQNAYVDYCGPFTFNTPLQGLPPTPTPVSGRCEYSFSSNNPKDSNLFTSNDEITIKGTLRPEPGATIPTPAKATIDTGIRDIRANLYRNGRGISGQYIDRTPNSSGGYDFEKNLGKFPNGNYNVIIVALGQQDLCPESTFVVSDSGVQPVKQPTASPVPSINIPDACLTPDGKTAQSKNNCSTPYDSCPWCPAFRPKKINMLQPTIVFPPLADFCYRLPDKSNFQTDCINCIGTMKNRKGMMWTAIGCVPIYYTGFVSYIFKYGVGFAGGIAFLYFLYGAFLYLTSSGNAERVENARQIITSSIMGILLIVFSILLLRIIGTDVLGIFSAG